jgi:hypothetical protein
MMPLRLTVLRNSPGFGELISIPETGDAQYRLAGTRQLMSNSLPSGSFIPIA